MSENKVEREISEKVEDSQFFVCWGFMRRRLKLEKTELLVYAIIYGFYRSGCDFKGGVRYLTEWTGNGATAVKSALSSLLKKGYIRKRLNVIGGVTYAEYSIETKAIADIELE